MLEDLDHDRGFGRRSPVPITCMYNFGMGDSKTGDGRREKGTERELEGR